MVEGNGCRVAGRTVLAGSSPLHVALAMGQLSAHAAFSVAAVPALLAAGAEPSMRDDRGFTALHVCAALSLPQQVRMPRVRTLHWPAEAAGGRRALPAHVLQPNLYGNLYWARWMDGHQ
jgi:hypothetical protein